MWAWLITFTNATRPWRNQWKLFPSVRQVHSCTLKNGWAPLLSAVSIHMNNQPQVHSSSRHTNSINLRHKEPERKTAIITLLYFFFFFSSQIQFVENLDTNIIIKVMSPMKRPLPIMLWSNLYFYMLFFLYAIRSATTENKNSWEGSWCFH